MGARSLVTADQLLAVGAEGHGLDRGVVLKRRQCQLPADRADSNGWPPQPNLAMIPWIRIGDFPHRLPHTAGDEPPAVGAKRERPYRSAECQRLADGGTGVGPPKPNLAPTNWGAVRGVPHQCPVRRCDNLAGGAERRL